MSATPCRFFLAGNCRNGARCRFYHEGFSSLPASTLVETTDSDEDEETSISPGHRTESGTGATATSSSSASASARPAYAASRACQWYMAGYCHRGESCWFSHDRGTVNAAYSGGQETIILSDDDEEDTGTQRRTSVVHGDSNDDDDDDDDDDQKCAICFEVPKTFGLLVSCNHAFCLECIRTWRSKDISSDLQPHDSGNVSVTKACPNCRTPSLYVVPSSFFPTCSEQKEIIIQNYKEATARKPCKYFKESGDRHWCPFGDDCHFAHLDEDGEPCKVNAESNPRLRQRRSNGGRAGYSRYPTTLAQVRREVLEAMRGTSRTSHQDYLRTLLLQLARLRTDMASVQADSRDSVQHDLAERDFDDDEPTVDSRIGGREWGFGRDNIYDDDDDDDVVYENDYDYEYDDVDSDGDEYYGSWREDERHLTTVHRG
ncbi:hypothetical protein EDD21DRAFT_359117 [Dissophora ornata]|nr:hypothetical protein BGZ58_002712 [Dissophora ornata]KAI8595344.1 hypothetical protein EDD21DRAFT_359117 [Dissophora ornata]